MVKMSDDSAHADSSDFSVISHPPEDSLANGMPFLPALAPLSLDDFRRQLQELLQENAQLKGALQQNTCIMRQHFATLNAWQEKLMTTNRRHKRALDDSRHENLALRTQITELEAAFKHAKEKEESWKKLSSESKDDTSKSTYTPYNDKAGFLYVDEDAGYTIVHHLGASKPESLDRVKEERCILSQKLVEEQLKSAGLQQQLERMNARGMESDLDEASSFIQRYKDRCISVEQWLSEQQGRMEHLAASGSDAGRLRQEIRSLHDTLSQEHKSREEDKEKIDKLLEDHRVLLQKWKSTQCEGRQTEALRAVEKRRQQEHADSLTAQLVGTQEELAACKQKRERLETQLELLRRDSEQVPILRAQVEIYRQDFEAERESKHQRGIELDKVRGEVSALQSQNAQLLDELSAIQRSGDQKQHRRWSRRHSPMHEGNSKVNREEQLEPCPKCGMTFASVLGLQNHIDQCLDAETSPYP